MPENKIVISREQYDVVKGAAKISDSEEFDVSHGIIEFGISFLISISFDKENSNSEKANDMLAAWKSESECVEISDAVMAYLNLEDKKEYVTNRNFFSFIGANTIKVAPEQKNTIKGIARFTGFAERTISHIVFESGVAFMLLASESSGDKTKDALHEWMQDDDIMKVADGLRKAWEASQ